MPKERVIIKILLTVNATFKRTSNECYNQKDGQEVLQSERLSKRVIIKRTTRPGSATVKRTARECHNQSDCQGILQSKGLRENVPIKMTARDCYNQKDCQ